MINKIKAINFLSWKNLNFDVKNGITLIDGWNEDDQTSEGSGKSAILNAITWCLYGKLPKEANMDDVIKHGEKTCRVEVTINDEFVVFRSRKPNDVGILSKKDNKEIKGKDARETQKIIEEHFAKMSFDTFVQSIYFAQNNPKKFISATQEERGKILSEVQDLTIFDRSRKEVMDLIKLEEKSLVELKHKKDMQMSELTLVDQKIKSIQDMVNLQENQRQQNLSSIEQEIRQQHTALQSMENNKQEYEKALVEQNNILNNMNNVSELEGSIQIAMEKRAQLVSQKAQIDDIKRTINRKKADGQRYGHEYNQLKLQINELKKFIDNPTKDCPTCGTTLEQCDTSHAHEEILKHQKRMVEIETTLVDLAKDINIEVKTTDELDNAINEEDAAIKGWRDQINTIHYTKNSIEKYSYSLQQLDTSIKQAKDKLDNELANKYLQEKNRVIDFDQKTFDELNIKKTQIEEALLSLSGIIIEKDKYINRLHSLKSGFKEIKSYIFNSILNEINLRIQNYLQHLFEVPVSLKFVNDNMKIGTEASINGNPQGVGLMSGGQGRRLSLATDLALSDVVSSRSGNSFNLLILDEYFKDLSEQSMEKCLQLLERRNQPTILIEHNSIFKNIVNDTFFVHYEQGTSSVKV